MSFAKVISVNRLATSHADKAHASGLPHHCLCLAAGLGAICPILRSMISGCAICISEGGSPFAMTSRSSTTIRPIAWRSRRIDAARCGDRIVFLTFRTAATSTRPSRRLDVQRLERMTALERLWQNPRRSRWSRGSARLPLESPSTANSGAAVRCSLAG